MLISPLFFHAVKAQARETRRAWREEVIIPSPAAPVLALYRALKARVAYAQAEQERFQQHLNAIGIERLSRMRPREVLEGYTPGPC